MEKKNQSTNWALILGGSSGFGLAAAKKLASEGMNICIVHRDRKISMEAINKEFELIKLQPIQLLSFNTNALDKEGIKSVIEALKERFSGKDKVRVLLHSIAFGSLKPLSPEKDPYLQDEDFSGTIYAMGTSIITWAHQLIKEQLLSSDSRILALTSEGNTIAWPNYAAVSAAKCALEATCRSMALEFAPYGIRTNVIQAGVTDTPALRLIPGNDKIKAFAAARNPFGRLTTTTDVADVIYLLTTDMAKWINGTIIKVDGGESISGKH